MLERGIVVSYEAIRRWGRKFGPDYARRFSEAPAADESISGTSTNCDLNRWEDTLALARRRSGWYVLDEIVQSAATPRLPSDC